MPTRYADSFQIADLEVSGCPRAVVDSGGGLSFRASWARATAAAPQKDAERRSVHASAPPATAGATTTGRAPSSLERPGPGALGHIRHVLARDANARARASSRITTPELTPAASAMATTVDLTFDRAVDLVHSLPKTSPIQIGYEECA